MLKLRGGLVLVLMEEDLPVQMVQDHGHKTGNLHCAIMEPALFVQMEILLPDLGDVLEVISQCADLSNQSALMGLP